MFKNKIKIIIAALVCGGLLSACSEHEKIDNRDRYVYMSAPDETLVAVLDLVDRSETEVILRFAVAYEITGNNTATVEATVAPDFSLVETWNKMKSKNMLPLPEEFLSFIESSVTIPSGFTEQSFSFKLINLDKLPTGEFLLPVTIKSFKENPGFSLYEAKKTAYVLIANKGGIPPSYRGKPYTANGEPHSVPGTVEAQDYDTGGNGIAYFDDTKGHPWGGDFPLYRHDEDVDIINDSAAGGGFYINSITVGEWLNYTIQVNAPGTYRISTSYASVSDGESYRLFIDNKDVTGVVAVPASGGWTTWKSFDVTVELTEGAHLFKWKFESGWSFSLDKFIFELQ